MSLQDTIKQVISDAVNVPAGYDHLLDRAAEAVADQAGVLTEGLRQIAQEHNLSSRVVEDAFIRVGLVEPEPVVPQATEQGSDLNGFLDALSDLIAQHRR